MVDSPAEPASVPRVDGDGMSIEKAVERIHEAQKKCVETRRRLEGLCVELSVDNENQLDKRRRARERVEGKVALGISIAAFWVLAGVGLFVLQVDRLMYIVACCAGVAIVALLVVLLAQTRQDSWS